MYKNLFEVYEVIAQSHMPTSCETIAEKTQLSVRTVQRIAKTWKSRGFIGVIRPANSNCHLYYAVNNKKP